MNIPSSSHRQINDSSVSISFWWASSWGWVREGIAKLAVVAWSSPACGSSGSCGERWAALESRAQQEGNCSKCTFGGVCVNSESPCLSLNGRQNRPVVFFWNCFKGSDASGENLKSCIKQRVYHGIIISYGIMAMLMLLLCLIPILADTLVMHRVTSKAAWATRSVHMVKADVKKRQCVVLQVLWSLSRSHSQVPSWIWHQ